MIRKNNLIFDEKTLDKSSNFYYFKYVREIIDTKISRSVNKKIIDIVIW